MKDYIFNTTNEDIDTTELDSVINLMNEIVGSPYYQAPEILACFFFGGDLIIDFFLNFCSNCIVNEFVFLCTFTAT